MNADRAEVSWDQPKKQWLVRIQVGEEVIRRHVHVKHAGQTDEQMLRLMAVELAKDEGYQLDQAAVSILR